MSRRREDDTRARWVCRWDGCPSKGHEFTAPAGMTALADSQDHHRQAHGVPTHRAPERMPA